MYSSVCQFLNNKNVPSFDWCCHVIFIMDLSLVTWDWQHNFKEIHLEISKLKVTTQGEKVDISTVDTNFCLDISTGDKS
jgi:hypothetical protein